MSEPVNPFPNPGHNMLTHALNSVINSTLEDSAQKLEKIGTLVGIKDFKKVTKKFLAYIKEFKKGVLYKDLQDTEQLILEEWEKRLRHNLLRPDMSDDLLRAYIKRFARIIRLHKNNKP